MNDEKSRIRVIVGNPSDMALARLAELASSEDVEVTLLEGELCSDFDREPVRLKEVTGLEVLVAVAIFLDEDDIPREMNPFDHEIVPGLRDFMRAPMLVSRHIEYDKPWVGMNQVSVSPRTAPRNLRGAVWKR